MIIINNYIFVQVQILSCSVLFCTVFKPICNLIQPMAAMWEINQTYLHLPLFNPSVDIFPREFNNSRHTKLGTYHQSCSQGFARCHVTRQCRSAEPAPKLLLSLPL